MRQVVDARVTITATAVVDLSQGGTAAHTAEEARRNLGMISADLINKVGGPIPLDINGKVDASRFESVMEYRAEVDGPSYLLEGETGEYTITNFDARVSFVLRATEGAVRRERDKIIYTAPTSGETAGFELNGEYWPIGLGEPTPEPEPIDPGEVEPGEPDPSDPGETDPVDSSDPGTPDSEPEPEAP